VDPHTPSILVFSSPEEQTKIKRSKKAKHSKKRPKTRSTDEESFHKDSKLSPNNDKKSVSLFQSNEISTTTNKPFFAKTESSDSLNRDTVSTSDIVCLITDKNVKLETRFKLLLNGQPDGDNRNNSPPSVVRNSDYKLRSFFLDCDKKIYVSKSESEYRIDNIFDHLKRVDQRLIQFVKFTGADCYYDELVSRPKNLVQIKLSENNYLYDIEAFYLCPLNESQRHYER
jgi:hypothetical protein